MSDLKSCPCGGDAKLIYEREKSYSVHNGENYTSIRCSVCSFNADHVDDWNARADGWISVDDRLPSIDEPVMVYADESFTFENYQRVMKARRVMVNKTDWYWYELDFGNTFLMGVTYWMPLPKPPKGK